MAMETQEITLADHHDYSSNVDTSRPFSSVKEAVAVFGERLLLGEIYSTKPSTTSCNSLNISPPPAWKYPSPSPSPSPSPTPSPSPSPSPIIDNGDNNADLFDALKKLEAELEETKMELRLLKGKESENEIALANLNAELHKNKSKLAEAEAGAAAEKAVSAARKEEETKRRGLKTRVENSPTLAEILSIGENNKEKYYYGGNYNKNERRSNLMMMRKTKMKPIVPLVTDCFFKKKGSSDNSTALHNPLYSSPAYNYFN